MINKQYLILSVALLASNAFGMQEIAGNALLKRNNASAASLYLDGTRFYAGEGDDIQEIESHNLGKSLRTTDTRKLQALIDNSCLIMNKASDGEYTLEDHGRIKGGGVWLSRFTYITVKAGLWGLMALSAGRIARRLGAQVGATVPHETISNLANATVAGTGGYFSAQVLGAAGTGVASAGGIFYSIALPEAAQAAVTATTAHVTAAAGVPSVSAMIEAIAMTAAAGALCLPTP